MAGLRLLNLSKTYPRGTIAVDGLNLEVESGELFVLLGPSGCGKTTTLRMIAGLEAPSGGAVSIDDTDVTALPPRRREVAMVAQEAALYPHLDVRENLEFALRLQRTSPEALRQRVTEVAEVLGIGPLLERRVWQLSGGERQRVALGRALVRRPRIFLFDEPLSNLDPHLRQQARLELARVQRTLHATMLYVTHDQEEAMALGHRVGVMHRGRIVQASTPSVLYNEPTNAFVAGFVGSPPMNLLRGRMRRQGGQTLWEGAAGSVVCSEDAPTPDRDVWLGFRAEHARMVASGEGDLTGYVEAVQHRGHDAIVQLRHAQGVSFNLLCPPSSVPALGDRVSLKIAPEKLVFLDAETEQLSHRVQKRFAPD